MACAECGCKVARGVRVVACDADDCCCAQLPLQTIEMLAAQVRSAMEALDITAMGELLAPNARWGAPEQDVPTCRNAQQILAWYEMARERGISADVTNVEVIDDNIVVALTVHSTDEHATHTTAQKRWQVLSVEDGRIAEIRGYEKRSDATTFAAAGVSNWTT
jgi:ketosteroid isomerase-like protein